MTPAQRQSETQKHKTTETKGELTNAQALGSLSNLGRLFEEFTKAYAHLFRSYRRDVFAQSRGYLHGLLSHRPHKNVTRIVEAVPGTGYEATQNFISSSQWAYQPVMDQVAADTDELFDDSRDTCLLIDETGFAKKGEESVGVARQYLGNLGKVDNGQVAVMAALANRERVAITDARLYLPECWTANPERCADAKVPVECQAFKTKDQIALDLIDHAIEQGLHFRWIGADAGYGKGARFCYSLDERKKTFMVDMHSDFAVYTVDPKPYVPCGAGSGRAPTRHRTDCKSITMRQWAASRHKSMWKTISTRRGTKGKVTYRYLFGQVWVWNGVDDTRRLWHIVVRKNLKGDMETCKYSLSNAAPNTTQERLAFMQGQRYWVERAFQDAKGHCGLADYQVRSWKAFHHHVALSMMALLFLLKARMQHPAIPLLSCKDAEQILAQILPRRDHSLDEIVAIIERRHRLRQRDIDKRFGLLCSG
jgi:SRSO17 transposase